MTDTNEYIQKVKELVKRQREFFATGKTRDIDYRIDLLWKFRAALDKYETEILSAIQSDLGKTPKESYFTELSLIINEVKLHAKSLKKWAEPEKEFTPIWCLPSKSYRVHEPLGEVLIISPWNYPFHLQLYPLIGAISAGNCALIKPSPLSPATNAVIAKLIGEIFKPEHVSILDADKEYTLPIIQEEKFDLIFYTGNSEFAKKVMSAAAPNLTPVILELGGKNPCIVDVETNVEVAAKRIVWGKLLNAGQTCIAPDYLYVHKSLEKEFIKALKYYEKIFYGKDAKKSKFYPKIINKEAVERLAGYLDCGKIEFGGKYDAEARYFEPTILTHVDMDSTVMKDEIFGPIFPVITFEKLDEVISYINSKPKPLAIYYFGETKPANKVLNSTSSGTACINDVIIQVGNPRLPFGGVGNSGMGKYHGWYGYHACSNEKSYMVSYFRIDNIFKFVPFKYFSIAKRILGTNY